MDLVKLQQSMGSAPKLLREQGKLNRTSHALLLQFAAASFALTILLESLLLFQITLFLLGLRKTAQARA